KNYFELQESKSILESDKKFGLKPKLHVNQLNNFGALQLAVDYKAISVDHLECISDIEIQYLHNKPTIATLLPACSFFIKIPYAPARYMIDSGLAISLASDFNPGSSPTSNMAFVSSLACIYQSMTPIEAFNASTINSAYALELSSDIGSISIGTMPPAKPQIHNQQVPASNEEVPPPPAPTNK
ncbi:unnamed protein product, partial [Cyprideis torosa]